MSLSQTVEVLYIKELVNQFLLTKRTEGRSPATIQWYSDILRAFSRYVEMESLGDTISSFTRETIRNYILYLQHKPKYEGHPFTPQKPEPLSPRTVQGHVRALKAFSTWLYDEGYTDENRLKPIKLPKAPALLIKPLTLQEIQIILDSIDRKGPIAWRNYSIVVMMLDTGFRESEVAGITISELDFNQGSVNVMGKGSKERVAPIGQFTQKILWYYKDYERPKLYINGSDYLFLSRSGDPITANAIKLMFSRLAKKSGIYRLHAHLCRHTFGINYLLNGGDIFSLKEIIGHTTLTMVMHYLHFTNAQITAQHHKYSPMDRMQSQLGQAKTLPLN